MLTKVACRTIFIDKILLAIFDAATKEANQVWMPNPRKIFNFPFKRIGGVALIYVFDGHNLAAGKNTFINTAGRSPAKAYFFIPKIYGILDLRLGECIEARPGGDIHFGLNCFMRLLLGYIFYQQNYQR